MEAGEDGRPVAVWLSGRRYAVEDVLETWRIDDEWWRERPVSRVYYQLGLLGGPMVVVHEDVVQGRWYVQRYA